MGFYTYIEQAVVRSTHNSNNYRLVRVRGRDDIATGP